MADGRVRSHGIRDRTNRPLLFLDRISNCTNLFRPKLNRTTLPPWITHAADQRCADPEMLRPHQSTDSDHRSASPFPTSPTQAPSRSRVSNPSEPGKLGHWRTINGCSCGAWSWADSDRAQCVYSICWLCSAGQLAKCRARVYDQCQSVSANFRGRAVRVSPWISRILADLRSHPHMSAADRRGRRPSCTPTRW